MVNLKDVYVTQGQPTTTYIARSLIEEKLEESLYEGGKIINIIGPSKIGKTVVVRHLIDKQDYVFIHCGSIKSIEEFYEHIAEQFEVAIETIKASTNGNTISSTIGSKIALSIQAILSGQAEVNSSRSSMNKREEQKVEKYSSSLAAKLKKVFSYNNIVLILDDFHYLKNELQTEILKVLKGWLTQNNSFVLTSVNHRKGEIVENVPELRGRSTDVEIDNWKEIELEGIIKKGEESLNIKFDDDAYKKIVNESFGNPMITQKICFKICYKNNVKERLKVTKKISIDSQSLENILIEIANDMSYENYLDQFKRGKDPKGKKRTQYRFRDGVTRDIYTSLIHIIKHNMEEQKYTVDQLADLINSEVVDTVNSKGEIKQISLSALKISIVKTLTNMNDIDNKSLELKKENFNKNIDFKPESKEFIVEDPFFAFFIKWSDKSDV